MSMNLTEYFVRHYTLVLDNDYDAYHAATAIAVGVVRESDITLDAYTALDPAERAERYAARIGDLLIDQIAEWVDVVVPPGRDHVGAMLVRELLILGDSDIEYALGEHYLPEETDLAGLLPTLADEDGQ